MIARSRRSGRGRGRCTLKMDKGRAGATLRWFRPPGAAACSLARVTTTTTTTGSKVDADHGRTPSWAVGTAGGSSRPRRVLGAPRASGAGRPLAGARTGETAPVLAAAAATSESRRPCRCSLVRLGPRRWRRPRCRPHRWSLMTPSLPSSTRRAVCLLCPLTSTATCRSSIRPSPTRWPPHLSSPPGPPLLHVAPLQRLSPQPCSWA